MRIFFQDCKSPLFFPYFPPSPPLPPAVIFVPSRRPGVSLHSHPARLRTLQCGLQASSWPQAEHEEERDRPDLCLDLLPILGRGPSPWLELLWAGRRADLLLSGLGGEVVEQLQLSHPLHAGLLHLSRRSHHILLLQSAHFYGQGGHLHISHINLLPSKCRADIADNHS